MTAPGASGPGLTRVGAIGEQHRVEGFALAGVLVRVAGDADTVREAWAALPDDVGVVLLTPAAAGALADVGWDRRLRVVLPA